MDSLQESDWRSNQAFNLIPKRILQTQERAPSADWRIRPGPRIPSTLISLTRQCCIFQRPSALVGNEWSY